MSAVVRSLLPLLSKPLLACLTALAVAPALIADVQQLTKEEVELVIRQAATACSRMNRSAVIAVTDREGWVLGVYDMKNRLPSPLPPVFPLNKTRIQVYGLLAGAITRAGTAAFLSSDENAFTSRTAGFIIQQHFPPGVRNTPNGPLVGVGFSNLFYSDINRFKQIPPNFDPYAPVPKGMSPGARGGLIPFGSLNDSPGGVPLYKGGRLVGGVGVTGDGNPTDLAPAAAIFLKQTQRFVTPGFVSNTQQDVDELCALAGQTNFRPRSEIVATNVLINGIRIPYVQPKLEDIEDVDDIADFDHLEGRFVDGFPAQASPPAFPYPVARIGGVEGELRFPIISDPLLADPQRAMIGKARRLNAAEVKDIITEAAARCRITRAGIRLPLGTSAKVWIVVVNNPQRNGEAPTVLGTFRVGEATMFSWDVATQKARTAVFFSNRQLAMSTRAVGFLSQRFFPPGLDGRPYGPFFGFQEAVSLRQHPRGGFPGNPNLPNGITIFPGGFPLYKDGYLVGAIGVSGDGIEQDDIISASGCKDFLPKHSIRADSYTYRGARLPYAKFPRDPVR